MRYVLISLMILTSSSVFAAPGASWICSAPDNFDLGQFAVEKPTSASQRQIDHISCRWPDCRKTYRAVTQKMADGSTEYKTSDFALRIQPKSVFRDSRCSSNVFGALKVEGQKPVILCCEDEQTNTTQI